jgi:cytochrome c553
LLLPAIAASAGGWAAITVEDLPEYVVAREPFTLTFTVRQHGVSRLNGLKATVHAAAGRLEATAAAAPGREAGQYTATLLLPDVGDWTITINSGFHSSSTTLMPLKVIDLGGRPPRALPAAERGRQLFVAKGCVTCHLHRDVNAGSNTRVGPELTGRRYPADYLGQFLANPAIAPRRSRNAEMPNLNLKPPEIAALVAFINTERQASR